MKKFLCLFILFFIAAIADAQVVTTSSDNFDTTAVGQIGGNRRKWKAVINLGGYIRTNGDTSISGFGPNANPGGALWDSLITTPSSCELQVDSLGPAGPNFPSSYIWAQCPDSNFYNWTGYRVKWVRATTDAISLERVDAVSSQGVTFTPLVTVNRALLHGDRIKMLELGSGNHSLVISRSNAMIDSVSVNDVTFQRASWRWGIRMFYFTAGTMKMDSMVIQKLPVLSPTDTVPPVIVSLVNIPAAPDTSQPITLTARVTDNYGLDSIYVRFGHQETGAMSDVLVVRCGTTTTKDTTVSILVGKQLAGSYIMQVRVTDDSTSAPGTHITTSSITTFPVALPIVTRYKIYDRFDTLATANIGGVRKKYVRLTNQPDTTGTIQINSDSTASPRSVFPPGTQAAWGAVAIDSLMSGSAVIGYRLVSKGTTSENSMYIYLRMSNKDWLTGNGYRLKVVNRPPGFGIGGLGVDEWEIDNITATAFNPLIVKQLEFQNGDSVFFMTQTGTDKLMGLVTGFRNGLSWKDSIVAIGKIYRPATWYTWVRGFVFSSPFKFDDLAVDTIPTPPPPPITLRDTIPPIFPNKGLSVAGQIDTSKLVNFFFQVLDETVNVYYSHIPSHGLDTVWAGVFAEPIDTLVTSLGKKIGLAFDTLITSPDRKYKVGQYMIRFFAKDDSGNVARDSLSFGVSSGASMWATTYYPNWMYRPLNSGGYFNYFGIPPWETKFQGLTHVIQFGDPNISTTPPYWQPLGGMPDSVKWTQAPNLNGSSTAIWYRDSLVKYVHLAGARCLSEIQAAQTGAALNTITLDSVATDNLCQSIALYNLRNKMDGTDINWEHDLPTPAQSSLLIRRLRFWFNTVGTWDGRRAVITMAPPMDEEFGYSHYDAAVCNANVDQINPQLYSNSAAWNPNVGANGMWYMNAIYDGTNPTGFEFKTYSTNVIRNNFHRGGMDIWAGAGFDKKILGGGVAAFARGFKGSNQLYGPWAAGGAEIDDCSSDAIAYVMANVPGAIQDYDSSRHAWRVRGTTTVAIDYRKMTIPANTQFWISYADTRNIPEQVDWFRNNGYGGLMLWNMANCGDPARQFSVRYPVIDAFTSAIGNAVIIPPSTPVPNTPTGNINSEPIIGLLLSWSIPTGTVNYHFQFSTDSLFASTVVDEVNYPLNSITMGFGGYAPLLYNTRYYWRVLAANLGGSSVYCVTQTFKTMLDPNTTFNPPTTPVLVTPANNAVSQPTTLILIIAKNAVGDTVTSFNIVVANDTNFTSIVKNDSLISPLNPQTTVSGLTQGSSYYWRGRAKNSAGYSAYTSRRKFTVSVTATIQPFTHSTIKFSPTAGLSIDKADVMFFRKSDPASWVIGDSAEWAFYGGGVVFDDGFVVNFRNLTGGGGGGFTTYQQVMAALNTASQDVTQYWRFRNGLSIEYGGSPLATFDQNGINFLANLNLTTAVNFTQPAAFASGLSIPNNGGADAFGNFGLGTKTFTSGSTNTFALKYGVFTAGTVDSILHFHTKRYSAFNYGLVIEMPGGSGITRTTEFRNLDGFVILSSDSNNVFATPSYVLTHPGCPPVSRKLVFHEEFVGTNSTARATSNPTYTLTSYPPLFENHWSISVNGAGAKSTLYGAATPVTADSGRIGLAQLLTDSTVTLGTWTGGVYSFIGDGSGVSGNIAALPVGDSITFDFKPGATLDSAAFAEGLIRWTAGNATSFMMDSTLRGLWFQYGGSSYLAGGGSADSIYACAGNGTAKTKVAVCPLSASTWTRGVIEVGRTSVNFRIFKQTNAFTSEIASVVISTNLPTSTDVAMPFAGIWSADKGGRTIVLDNFDIYTTNTVMLRRY